jgi:hypothetical protein
MEGIEMRHLLRCGRTSLVTLFIVIAAAVEGFHEWERIKRFTVSAYELADAAWNDRIIYTERMMESRMAPLAKRIAELEKKLRNTSGCSQTGGHSSRFDGR